MKKIAITLFLVLGSLTIQSQELTWQTDMNKALEISKKSKKPLFLFFTGSDWCGWCIRLQKEVFKTPEFAKWAKDNVILVELDFPRSTPQQPEIKKQNAELQQIFAVQGYPTVWFVRGSKKDGKINLEKLGSTGYVAGGPTAWLAAADKILANKPTKTTYTTN
jgi:thioredoxin-related protein